MDEPVYPVSSGSGIGATFLSYVDNIVLALVVLIVGTVIAWAISKAAQWAFGKTKLDDKLAGWMHSDGTRRSTNSERWIGRIVFWVIMLFVLIGVFQALDAPAISEPLNGLLSEITQFIPRLIGAALLLAVAWVVATVVRTLITKGLGSLNLDDRVNRHLPDTWSGGGAGSTSSPGLSTSETTTSASASKRPTLAKSLGDAAYWLVFLMFLPMILDVLGLEGLLQPLMDMLREVLEFIPNLFVAAVILLIGWFIARVVRNVVSGLLGATGVDRFARDAGLSGATGRFTLSQIIAWVVYIVILIPVVITALEALQIDTITEPATAMLEDIMLAIPRLVAAAILLVITYAVGKLIANVVANLLNGFGLDRMLSDLGLVQSARDKAVQNAPAEARGSLMQMQGSASTVIGKVILVALMLFAIVEALRLLEFDSLANLVMGFLVLLGNVVLGLIIIALGLALAQIAARAVRQSGVQESETMARVARIAVIVLAVAMGLRQMGIADSIINLAFGLTLGSIAIAAAVAFGIGGRDIAKRKLEQWVHRVERPEIITTGTETLPRSGLDAGPGAGENPTTDTPIM